MYISGLKAEKQNREQKAENQSCQMSARAMGSSNIQSAATGNRASNQVCIVTVRFETDIHDYIILCACTMLLVFVFTSGIQFDSVVMMGQSHLSF